MKEKIIERILNLIKMKSIVTLVFLGLVIYSVVSITNLPEWLISIIAICFRELFDKDKSNIKKEGE